MKDFGTFDTLTDEEDTIYNRLSAIGVMIDCLDYEQNDAQQDIKMWRNKMMDDKIKVKFWLIVSLIVGVGALPWYMLVLAAVPPGIDLTYGYIFNVIATFMALVQQFVFLPAFIITFIVFLVWLVLNILRNSNKDSVIKLAEQMGVENRNVLIREQKEIVGNKAIEIEKLKEEEAKLKLRLDSIRRTRE